MPSQKVYLQVCSGPDVGLLVGFIVLLLIVLWCVYWVAAHENVAKRKGVYTLLAIIGSQFITIFQMVGALKALAVEWTEPFATLVELGSVMNFKLEILNLGCVVSTSPIHRYIGNIFSVTGLVACILLYRLLHLLTLRCRSRTRFQETWRSSSVFGAVGTVFMTIFISVTTAIFQPLQCDSHPNGQSTMRAYRQVVCWNTEDDQEHQQFLLVGAVASLIPLGFLSVCLWATTALPKRLYLGDTMFLQRFAFLFFRFRARAHWFVVILLIRNMAFALVPLITDLAVELLAFSVVVLFCIVVSCSVFPWSVYQANHLDIGIHIGLLQILFLAAVQTRYADEVFLGNLLLVAFCISLLCFLGAGAWCLRLYYLTLRKPFPYFLCHHKEGGGAFCRLLKIRLKRRCPGHGDVFLDADNLVDLSTLFDIVRERTDMLVVLCTRDILRRPWCVGEMTTARLRKVDTVLLIFPEFEWPSNTFIEDYVTHVEGVVSLAEYGIHVEMAQDTLRWLLVRPQIVLPHAMTMAGVDATVAKLIQCKHGRTETVSVVGALGQGERSWL